MLRSAALLTVLLALMWALLSGRTTWLIVALGVFSVTFTLLYARRLKIIGLVDIRFGAAWRGFRYGLWLSGQIAAANFAVIAQILRPKLANHPVFTVTSTKNMTETQKTAFANSITLTPGTVSVELLPEQMILVHAVDTVFAKEESFEQMRQAVNAIGERNKK